MLAKAVCGGLFVVTFLGAMIRYSPGSLWRWLAGAGLAVTVWVTVASCLIDRRRTQGRQIRLDCRKLWVTTPDSQSPVLLADVARADWRGGAGPPGLCLYNADGKLLVDLDGAFLANEAEARAFLAWMRARVAIGFKVNWPA